MEEVNELLEEIGYFYGLTPDQTEKMSEEVETIIAHHVDSARENEENAKAREGNRVDV